MSEKKTIKKLNIKKDTLKKLQLKTDLQTGALPVKTADCSSWIKDTSAY
jgi:hypothetical protein